MCQLEFLLICLTFFVLKTMFFLPFLIRFSMPTYFFPDDTNVKLSRHISLMIFVFFKLRFKSHFLQYFSNFSCNPFLENENISESSMKSKELICVLNNSGNTLSSYCASYFSNSIGGSFINNLKNIA